MYEIQMMNGSIFWTKHYPTDIVDKVSMTNHRLALVEVAHGEPSGSWAPRSHARNLLADNQTAQALINPDAVSAVVDLG